MNVSAYPSLAHIIPSITNTTSSQVTVQFQQLSLGPEVEDYYSYTAQIQAVSARGLIVNAVMVKHRPNEAVGEISVGDLEPNTEYVVTVIPNRVIDVRTYGNNKQEMGEYSQEYIFITGVVIIAL